MMSEAGERAILRYCRSRRKETPAIRGSAKSPYVDFYSKSPYVDSYSKSPYVDSYTKDVDSLSIPISPYFGWITILPLLMIDVGSALSATPRWLSYTIWPVTLFQILMRSLS